MILQFPARVARSIKWRVRRFRGKLRIARNRNRDDLAAFWRDHGAEWARDEADPNDLRRLSEILVSTHGLSNKKAAATVALSFRQVWKDGFSSREDAFGWDEMGDKLPETALLAFARGADEVFRRERQGE
jgi:hypothetical protein